MPHNPAIRRSDSPNCWPSLPLSSWQSTRDTLHMWTQIVGKVRLALTPLINHWWNVPLYVSARGLTTSLMPYESRSFELEFDFIDHRLMLRSCDGALASLPLSARPVADFYRDLLNMLRSSGFEVSIWHMPVEIPNPIPFDQDRIHDSYDPVAVQKFWRILTSVDAVLQEFRSRFIGKSSPVHFFWGSFDLALTRFSGRPTPEPPGADSITREAYSHEVSSVGFWTGSGETLDPAFYCYASPEPPGFRESSVQPPAAHYHRQMGEFILMYEDVRRSPSPGATLLDFCQTSYNAAADNGKWDRKALERAA